MNIINKIKDCLKLIMRHKPTKQSEKSCNYLNPGTNKLNALLFSDFHGTVEHEALKQALLNQPKPDAIFTLGDISVPDLSFIKTVFPAVPIYGICGNHDELTTLDMVGIPNIHGKVIDLAGARFAGFGGSVRYKRGSYVIFANRKPGHCKSLVPG